MKANQKSIDIQAAINFVWRIRWFLVAGFGLGAGIGLADGMLSRPIYESQALLAPAKGQQSMGGLAGLLGKGANLGALLDIPSLGASDTSETVAVLRSRSFRLRFIEQHGLLPYLYPNQWDAKQHKWREGSGGFLDGLTSWMAKPVPGQAQAGPPPENILLKFDKLRTVDIDRRTGMVVISLRGPTPALARDWAQATIDDVNSDLRANTLEASGRAVKLIRERLESENVMEVRTSLASLLEIELKNIVAAMTRPDFALRVIDAPSLPGRQIYPRPVRMMAAGAFAGTALAYVCCVLWFAYRRSRAV